MLVGMLVGWGFGAATMAAATRARSQVLLRSDYEIAQQTYVELYQTLMLFISDILFAVPLPLQTRTRSLSSRYLKGCSWIGGA